MGGAAGSAAGSADMAQRPALARAARRPAVAGQFYPADPDQLAEWVDAMVAAVELDGTSASAAFVVPHAGYRYSGSTAAHAYARLQGRGDVDRVVLLGPAHFVALDGCAVPATDTWLTPLGEVALDLAGAEALVSAGLATRNDEPHAPEHSLEVQLPFLQRVLDSFRLLPIAVGVSSMDSVAACVAGALAHPDTAGRTVVICSTDLSHYLDEDSANAHDEQTVQAIRDLAPELIMSTDACGSYALRGLLGWARRAGMTAHVLHRCTSASSGGPASRVVGYAAVELRY
jgi:AmmeMemoRadiSam system protein B